MVCDCKEGYFGSRCDVCADNYYGNPEEPGGVCVPCDCSDKIDLNQRGNCDPHTGKCLRCLGDTTGDHCEVCREGFFRYADDLPCQGELFFYFFNTWNITVLFQNVSVILWEPILQLVSVILMEVNVTVILMFLESAAMNASRIIGKLLVVKVVNFVIVMSLVL